MRKLSRDTRRKMLKEIGDDKELVKTMPREGIREQFEVLKETEASLDFLKQYFR